MRQATGRLGLAIETQPRLLEFLVFEFFLDRDRFQRDRAVDARVPGQVHGTHCATPDTALDDVTPEALRTYAVRHLAALLHRLVSVRALHPFEHGFGAFRLGLFLEGQRELVHDGCNRFRWRATAELGERRLKPARGEEVGAFLEGIFDFLLFINHEPYAEDGYAGENDNRPAQVQADLQDIQYQRLDKEQGNDRDAGQYGDVLP